MAEGTSCQAGCTEDSLHKVKKPSINSYGLLKFDLLALNTCKIENRRHLDLLKNRYNILKKSLSDGCASDHQSVSLYLILATYAQRLNIDEDEESAEHFLEKVLEIDPYNLNALADLHQINAISHLTEEAKENEKKFSEKVNDKALQAKSIAEKAYAVAYDVHMHTRKYERYSESNKLYEEALKLAESSSSSTNEDGESTELEIVVWYYVMGENYKRIYNIMTETECCMDNRIEIYDKATEYFFKALQSSNRKLKRDTWSSVGTLFCKKPKLLKGQKYPTFVGSCDMLKEYYIDKPLDCFEKALEEHRSMRVKVEYGWQCYRLRKTEKAMTLLSDVIQEDPENPRNWYAYSRRSKINRLTYRDSLKKASSTANTDSPTIPDKSLLNQAKSDSLKCIEMNQSALEYANLAEIYHMLGVDSNGKVVDKSAIKKALKNFVQAEDCQDGVIRPDVHQRRALCLCDNGQRREAIEQFKRAIECENNNTKYVHNFIYLMQNFFQQYRDHKEEHILRELAFWFRKGIDRYGSVNVDKFNESSASELLTLGKHLLDNQQLKYAKRCFSALQKYHDESIRCEAKTFLKKTQDLLKQQPKEQAQGHASNSNAPKHEDNVETGGCQRELQDVESSAQSEPSTVETSLVSDTKDETASMRPSESGGKLTLLAIEHDPSKNQFSITSPDGEITSDEHKEQFSRKSLETRVYRTCSFIDQSMHNKPEIPPPLPTVRNVCGKEYDFFPVYCEEDEEWIWYTLLPKLEEELKFKGCIQSRDLIAGRQILDNISDAIEKSARVLLILSPQFFKDKLCERILHMALMEDDIVIPFVMEEYKECKASKVLACLEKVYYFKYLDWMQLQKSLLAGMKQLINI
ncbi:uncharacterized protein LOC144434853 [Glandiceps talaboti]